MKAIETMIKLFRFIHTMWLYFKCSRHERAVLDAYANHDKVSPVETQRRERAMIADQIERFAIESGCEKYSCPICGSITYVNEMEHRLFCAKCEGTSAILSGSTEERR